MGVRSSIINYFEKRSSLKNPPYWLIKMMGIQSSSGVSVNNTNAENLSAYYANRLLFSNTLATVPLNVRRTDTNGNRYVDKTHPAYKLLAKKPNPFQTSYIWRTSLAQKVIDSGNAYSLISRNGMGIPVQFGVPMGADKCTPFIFTDPDTGQQILFYKIQGRNLPVYASDILHFRNPIVKGSDNELEGKSVLTAARESIGLGLTQQEYGNKTYANGGGKRIALTSDKRLDDKVKKGLRKGWKERYGGPDGNAEVAILEAGVDVKEIGMNPVDADFLNSRKFTHLEICQFFGLFQPSKIGIDTNSNYNSLEQQSIAFVTDSMMPWFVQFEQEIDDKLFSGKADQDRYTKFNINSLMRGDTAARKEWYRTLFNIGVFSRNDILALEDMNAIDDGDTRFLQQNLAPAEMLGELMDLKYSNQKKVVEPKTTKE